MIQDYDALLRPKALSAFIGQQEVKTILSTVIKAAKIQRQPVGHILLSGPAGTGKTSLAHIVAAEMSVPCWATTGTNLATQLADHDTLFEEILLTFEQHGVLFVDEIHRVANLVQDTLLPLLERNWLAIKYRAPRAGLSVRKGDWVALNGTTKAFTFIGATTRMGLLQDPFRDRFKLQLRLDYYDDESMFKIANRTAYLLEMGISGPALVAISKRAKGTPRIVNNILWYCRQWEIAHDKYIDITRAKAILAELSIDKLGLNKQDRKLLAYLIELDRPAGLTTICAYLSEDRTTVETTIEPILIRAGLLVKTPRGRIVSEKAIQHMKGAT